MTRAQLRISFARPLVPQDRPERFYRFSPGVQIGGDVRLRRTLNLCGNARLHDADERTHDGGLGASFDNDQGWAAIARELKAHIRGVSNPPAKFFRGGSLARASHAQRRKLLELLGEE